MDENDKETSNHVQFTWQEIEVLKETAISNSAAKVNDFEIVYIIVGYSTKKS